MEKWVEVAHFKWWGDLDDYLKKRTTASGSLAKATKEMLDVLSSTTRLSNKIKVKRYELKKERRPVEVLRSELTGQPDKIPSCLGDPAIKSLKAHLKATSARAAAPLFRPPRAARRPPDEGTDYWWLAMTQAVARYCRCRFYEKKISRAPDACAATRAPPAKPPRITIAVLSYLPTQTNRLKETVRHYASLGSLVRRIVVQWNGVGTPPVFDATPPERGDVRFTVVVDVQTFRRNTLLNRYSRADAHDRGGAILLQDDDVRYSRRALRTFSSIHALFPDAILGLQGRVALRAVIEQRSVGPGLRNSPKFR